MTHSPTGRYFIAIGEILLIAATSLGATLWPIQPASATIASPGSLSSTSAPAGIIINSPWVVDTAGTEWAYGTTSSTMGTLISRNPATGEFTSRAIITGDEGAIAGLYSPLTNMAIFSARRTGSGNRITTFDLSTGTRVATRVLANDETLIRALTFSNIADSYIVGTNQNPAKVMKYGTTTGTLEYSSTFATGLKEVTAFIPNGNEILAAVNTTPIKLVSFTRNKLVLGAVQSLPSGTPTLMDVAVVGTTAYLGTDATPGRITAIDIATKTVIGTASLNTGEIGARNLVVDESTGTLYATTDSSAGPRIASFRLTDLRRLGTTHLSAGSSATSLLFFGGKLAAGFSGARGVETFTVAPEPNAPVVTGVQESDSSLIVSWNSGGSVEPIIEYTATATSGSSSASCSSNGTTCTIRGLNNGTTYTISVTARSAAGVSQATLASGMPRAVPEAPTTPRVTRGNTYVSVTWTPRGDGGMPITGYRATASPSGQMCESVTPTCTISGLPNGIAQTVQVVARNSVGTSQPSAPSASVTPATTPGTPHIETASRLNRGAVVVWKPPTDDGGDAVVSYLVRVTQGSNLVSESTTSTTSISLDGLTNGVTYEIVVSAANTVGSGGLSNPTYVTPATVPNAPGAITARRQDSGTDLSWTIPSNNGGDPITGYRIQVQQGNQRPTSFVTTGSPYSIRGLENGSTYSVTVSAINSVGDGVASESARVTPATIPFAPRAITVQRQNKAADISWTAPSNNGGDPITGYRVHVRKGNESPVSFVATESPYSIRGLENGTTYSVNVNAINSVGDSVASESALVTPATVPDAPRAIAALRLDKAADVSWLAPSNDGGDPTTSYRVQIWHGDEPTVTFVTTESRYSIQGLKNGTTYSTKVSAINSVGDSVASESVSVTPATVPTAPFALIAVRQDHAAEVSWAVPTNDGGDHITGYRVLVSTGNEPVTSYVTTEPHYSLRGLENGTTYSIFVGAINSVGESGASELVVVTPATVPNVPRAIVAARQDKSADVSWDVPSNDGGDSITGYRVHVRKGDEMPLIFVATGSPYSIAGLDNGTTYAVTVSAINSVGDGVASESVTVTPATVPTPPRAMTAQRQDRAVNVSWTAPSSDGGDPVVGHHVRVWVEATIVDEIETSNSSVVVAGLNNGTQYRVTATAFNSVGESVASDSAFVTPATIPAAPLAITTSRQNSGADVSWTVPPNDGGDHITGYHVRVHAGNQPLTRFITTESWYSIRGLDNGTTYTVTVSAINSVGESIASDSVEVTPATIPDPPSLLTTTAMDGGAELEWCGPLINGGDPLTGYRVRVWSEAHVIAEFATSISRVSVTGLTNGEEYRITVTSLNSVGESIASQPRFVTPTSPLIIEPPIVHPPITDPPIVEPPIVEPPIVEPPVVDPPVTEPPIIDPPVVDPPVVDPPPTVRAPSPPVDISVISSTRKFVTVGWRVADSGGEPVIDFIVHVSRNKNRDFTVWSDATSATPRVELRKPRRGSLYVRVIAVTRGGESAPTPPIRVVPARR